MLKPSKASPSVESKQSAIKARALYDTSDSETELSHALPADTSKATSHPPKEHQGEPTSNDATLQEQTPPKTPQRSLKRSCLPLAIGENTDLTMTKISTGGANKICHRSPETSRHHRRKPNTNTMDLRRPRLSLSILPFSLSLQRRVHLLPRRLSLCQILFRVPNQMQKVP